MISSVHNPRIQAVRKLQAQAKTRISEGAFVIEGVRLAEEAMLAGWEAQQVFYTDQLDQRGQAIVEQFSSRGVPFEMVSETVMRAASDTETPQGILVVLRLQSLPFPLSPDFLLILDGVRDPGNMGTILRTAAAACVQAVLLAPGNTDAWSPKVLRAGMGAHFRVPMQLMGWEKIVQVLKRPGSRIKIYLADVSSGTPYTKADFRGPLALIIGSEAEGAGDKSRSLADERVHIPMPGGSESLNAGIAASILLFEILRQRDE